MVITKKHKDILNVIAWVCSNEDNPPTSSDIALTTKRDLSNIRKSLAKLEGYGLIRKVNIDTVYSMALRKHIKRDCFGWVVNWDVPKAEKVKPTKEQIDELISSMVSGFLKCKQ